MCIQRGNRDEKVKGNGGDQGFWILVPQPNMGSSILPDVKYNNKDIQIKNVQLFQCIEEKKIELTKTIKHT